MIFFFRETLTEEDRAAWRRLRSRWKREVRKKRRRDVLDWIGDKFSSLACAAAGALMLYAVSSGGMSVGYLFCAAPMLVAGTLMFAARGRFPDKETDLLPKEDILPPDPARAVFFGDGSFTFWERSVKVRMGYSAVTGAWEDGERFYLLLQNRIPLVLPKRGLGRWMPEDFRDFLERETGAPVKEIG